MKSVIAMLSSSCLAVVPALAGDEPARRGRSENGRFIVEIDRAVHGTPVATLLDREERATVWEVELPHAEGPVGIFVRDDGQYVVMLGDAGEEPVFAAMVYDATGQPTGNWELAPYVLTMSGKRDDSAADAARDGDDDIASEPVDATAADVGQARDAQGPTAESFHDEDLEEYREAPETKRLLDEVKRNTWAGGARGEFVGDDAFHATLRNRQVVKIPLNGGGPMEFGGTSRQSNRPNQLELDGFELAGTQEFDAVASELVPGPDYLALLSEAIFSSAESEPGEVDLQSTTAEPVQLVELGSLPLYLTEASQSDPLQSEVAAEPGSRVQVVAPPGSGALEIEYIPPTPDPANPVNYREWLTGAARPILPPDVEQAHEIFATALDDLPPMTDDERELVDRAANGDAEALADPRLATWQQNFGWLAGLAASVADLPYSGRPIEINDEPLYSMTLQHLPNVRLAARSLVIEGRQAVAAGDLATGVERHLDALAVGRQQSGGYTLIEGLVGAAVQRQSLSAIRDAMKADVAGELDYDALAERIEQSSPIRDLAEYMQFERAATLDVVQRTYRPEKLGKAHLIADNMLQELRSLMARGDEQPTELVERIQLFSAGVQGTANLVNQAYDGYVSALERPFSDGIDTLRAHEQALRDPRGPYESNPLTRRMVPSFQRSYELWTEREADLRGTALAARIKGYQKRHGALPVSLEEVDPDGRLHDPFSGGEFRYLADGGDFSLHSAGTNQVEDGALEQPDPELDLVVWPPRVK